MRLMTIGIIGCLSVGMTGLALANPALLPLHPGYPSRGESSDDRGQQNLTATQSLRDAAESENANMVQQLEDPHNPTLLRREGAGLLPIDPGSNTTNHPLVNAPTNHKPKE